MGNITNDMTRLRGEIDVLRGARGALIRDLTATVSAMRAGFDAAHTAMAKKNRRDRVSYVTGIKKQVSKMRKENAADLAGARNAWCGKGTKY